MSEEVDEIVLEEIARTCSGLGIQGTDLESMSIQIYRNYRVQREEAHFAVASVAIVMHEYNSDIPLDFIVAASSVENIEQVSLLKNHIEETLGLKHYY